MSSSATEGTAHLNLDRIAAKRGQAIVSRHLAEADKLDREVTKLLAVTQEHGVYAGFLYLYAKTEKKYVPTIRDELFGLLREDLASIPTVPHDLEVWHWAKVSNALTAEDGLLSNLDRLFLVKDLIEQTLVYARFGAKAATEENDSKKERREEPPGDGSAPK